MVEQERQSCCTFIICSEVMLYDTLQTTSNQLWAGEVREWAETTLIYRYEPTIQCLRNGLWRYVPTNSLIQHYNLYCGRQWYSSFPKELPIHLNIQKNKQIVLDFGFECFVFLPNFSSLLLNQGFTLKSPENFLNNIGVELWSWKSVSPPPPHMFALKKIPR